MKILKVIKQQVPPSQTKKEETTTPSEPHPIPTREKATDTPTTSSEIQTPETEKSSSKTKKYYQAIGWLFGIVSRTEAGKFVITLDDGTSFSLGVPRQIAWILLRDIEAEPNRPLWLRCYPQYRLKEQALYFHCLRFSVDSPEGAVANMFVFRGIWQFIPQNKRPVFSIYRNQLHFPNDRVNNQHLPLIWKDELPFRFRKDGDERPQFYQIEVKLLSKLSCFGWARNLAEPSKPPKKVKKVLNPENISQSKGWEM
ncbi:MAG: hypothetical protein ACRC11_11440 [Xenococcaceae cyanobacterium]